MAHSPFNGTTTKGSPANSTTRCRFQTPIPETLGLVALLPGLTRNKATLQISTTTHPLHLSDVFYHPMSLLNAHPWDSRLGDKLYYQVSSTHAHSGDSRLGGAAPRDFPVSERLPMAYQARRLYCLGTICLGCLRVRTNQLSLKTALIPSVTSQAFYYLP